MTLAQIREARAAKINEMRSLVDSNPKLTADQQKQFDALKTDITGLEADEQRAVFLNEAERRQAGTPVDRGTADLERRVTLQDAINAQIENRGMSGALAEFNQEMTRQGVVATRGGILVPSSIFEARTTQTTTSQTKIVPDDYRADEFIGLLRNAMVMKSLGARVLSGLRGDTVIPKQLTSHTGYWVAEGASLTESNPTFDTIKLVPRHVGALSSISRQLLQQSNPSIEGLIRDDFVNVIGLAIDKAMLHGVGSSNEPVGIFNAANVQTGNLATLGWAGVVALLEKLALENATPNAFVTHPKAATKFQTTLKDASAGSEYLMQAGRMAGLPVHVTNQMDVKAGSPDKYRLLLGDFSQLVVGQWGSAEILANPYATGYYEKGDIQLRIMATMDMAVRNPKAFVKIEDIAV